MSLASKHFARIRGRLAYYEHDSIVFLFTLINLSLIFAILLNRLLVQFIQLLFACINFGFYFLYVNVTNTATLLLNRAIIILTWIHSFVVVSCQSVSSHEAFNLCQLLHILFKIYRGNIDIPDVPGHIDVFDLFDGVLIFEVLSDFSLNIIFGVVAIPRKLLAVS